VRLRPVILTWLSLLVLLAVEFFARTLPVGGTAAPFIGLAMVIIVSMTFTRLPSAPGVASAFALAGVFWLAVLMGLGSLDPATRHDIPLAIRTAP
jgi:cytochrome c oxidase subunit 4